MIASSNLSRREFVKTIILGPIGGISLVNSMRLSGHIGSPVYTKKGKEIGTAGPNIITIILDDQVISSFDLMLNAYCKIAVGRQGNYLHQLFLQFSAVCAIESIDPYRAVYAQSRRNDK